MNSKIAAFSDAAKAGAFKRFPDGSVDFFDSLDFAVDCTTVNLNRVIARGSYGVVYEGTWNGESYAIKIEDFTLAVEDQVNLIVELTLLQSLPHNRMVRFYGAGYQPDSLTGPKSMILMELCKNGTLRDVLKLRPPWNLIVRLLLDVARGIDFLHGLNIIHRDIKTANVLVDEEWRGKLCDFSFACNEECFSKKDFIYGTEEFMSPEISLALDFDRTSDIFSFGITLCETITFREPSAEFLCRKAQHIFALDEKELADAVIEGCPEELEALACQCCDVDTSKRPTIQTCIDELEALLHSMGGEGFEYNPDRDSKGQNGTLVNNESPLCLDTLNLNLDSDTASPDNVNGDVDKGGNCGGKDRATEHSEADARFAMMNIQIEGLRAENLRLSSALRDLAALVTDKAACTQTLALADVKERRSSSRKEKESSDGWPEAFHQRRGPSVEISNIGDSCAHRTSEKNMNVCWVDTMSLSADSHDSVKGAETPVTGKISQAKLLRQLDSIQNQLDATKKQIMGTVRRSSFTKPNPVLADSFRVVNAPLSLTSGRPKSFSNLPSPSSNLSHFPFPSPKSNAVFLPSQEATLRRSAKASIDQLDTDGCEVEKVENCEKFWDLNHLKDEHFNSISRITSDLVDRKKKLSPRYSDEDSRNGLIIAASRCKELAQSSPVNTDLSTALDKYLNVVRKLSASAARTDTRDLGSKDCEEVIISLNNGFQRSMSSNSNSNMTCSNNSNSVSNSVQMESNCNLILKGQHTAWRVSEGARLSPENRMFLGTNECNARPVMTE